MEKLNKKITADSFRKSCKPERYDVPDIYIYFAYQNGDIF